MGARARIGSLSFALFALNAAIVWPLFGAEYLNDFQSVEGIFITFGRFLREYWPHASWFPWSDAGMPFENSYLPLVSYMVAAIAFVARCSPAHAFHFLTALFYSLGPVFLFLFARRLSGRVAPAFLAAVFWSLLSPSSMVPELLRDIGTVWGSRRLMNIVVYGETPHAVSVALLPLALLLLGRALDRLNPRRFALAVLALAAMMLSNTFGIVVAAVGALILAGTFPEAAHNGPGWRPVSGLHGGRRRILCALTDFGWRPLARTAGMLFAAYLLICRFLPPSLARLIAVNAQSIGGDYRFTWKARLIGVAFAVALAALWWLVRRRADPAMRFALLFAACFAGIPILFYAAGVSFLPQPNRYQLEMDLAVCLLAAFVADAVLRRLPRRSVVAIAAVSAVAFAWIATKNYQFARRLIHPVDVTRTVAFREARWIGSHLPGQRVFIAGENEYWFNLFADNPQLSAGHDPSAPNWMQRVAVYAIYSGRNAGDRDGPISVFWLKAFGCGAVAVPGPNSADAYKAVVHPRKFDGLIPLVWRDDDESIYQVPLRSASLAHVIPESAMVRRHPIHGLDIDPVEAYVAALDDPALPSASLVWQTPERGRISTNVAPGEVVALQVNYDPGWEAREDDRPLRIRRDGLGLMIIDPGHSGPCKIDLAFTGGPERIACLAVSLAAALALICAMLWPRRHRIP
jgi:hypothetical protein